MAATPRDPWAHLDLFELDALRAGDPVPAVVAAHAAWCADCAAALAALGALQQALLESQPTTTVPPARQAAILASLRTQAARTRRTRRRVASSAVAAAAIVVLAVVTLLRAPLAPRPEPRTVNRAAPASTAARDMITGDADRDGDGRVTVLDAFALARAGTAPPARIEALLAKAVSLENNP